MEWSIEVYVCASKLFQNHCSKINLTKLQGQFKNTKNNPENASNSYQNITSKAKENSDNITLRLIGTRALQSNSYR